MGKNECTQWKFYQGIRKYKKIQLEIKNSKAEINTHTHTHTHYKEWICKWSFIQKMLHPTTTRTNKWIQQSCKIQD